MVAVEARCADLVVRSRVRVYPPPHVLSIVEERDVMHARELQRGVQAGDAAAYDDDFHLSFRLFLSSSYEYFRRGRGMQAPVLALGMIGVGCGGYLYYHRSRPDLESIRDIQDVVDYIHHISQMTRSTERLVAHISDTVREDGISEACLQTLSDLHKAYGSDNGINGYAVNLLWSTIVYEVSRDAIILE